MAFRSLGAKFKLCTDIKGENKYKLHQALELLQTPALFAGEGIPLPSGKITIYYATNERKDTLMCGITYDLENEASYDFNWYAPLLRKQSEDPHYPYSFQCFQGQDKVFFLLAHKKGLKFIDIRRALAKMSREKFGLHMQRLLDLHRKTEERSAVIRQIALSDLDWMQNAANTTVDLFPFWPLSMELIKIGQPTYVDSFLMKDYLLATPEEDILESREDGWHLVRAQKNWAKLSFLSYLDHHIMDNGFRFGDRYENQYFYSIALTARSYKKRLLPGAADEIDWNAIETLVHRMAFKKIPPIEESEANIKALIQEIYGERRYATAED